MHGLTARVDPGHPKEAERGAVLVLLALSLVALLMLTAIVVDFGNAFQLRRQDQNAADAGALAGVQALSGLVPTAAQCFQDANQPWSVSCAAGYAATTIAKGGPTLPVRQLSGCPPTVTACYTAAGASIQVTTPWPDDATPARAVHVQVCAPVTTAFAGVIGMNVMNTCAQATAHYTPASGGECGVCVLSPDGNPAFIDSAGGALMVNNTNFVVNSTAALAAKQNGGGALTLGGATPGRWGGPAAPGGFSWRSNSTSPVALPAVADPLAAVPQCPGAGSPSPCPPAGIRPYPSITCGACGTLIPGVYASVSVSGSATFSPGTYVITNQLHFSNSGTINAAGVTFYLACSSYPSPCNAGQQGAFLQFTGGGPTVISSPTTGPFAGLAVFFDRNNTSNPSGGKPACNGGSTSNISAGGSMSISGTIYMASSCLDITGGGGALGTALVVGLLEDTAGGSVTIDPSGRQAMPRNPAGFSLTQ